MFLENFLNIINKDMSIVRFVSNSEAESIKLFSNSYLALRVAFFNELDNFALANNHDAKKIIDGLAGDPRIGSHYNNPSFGYGGYCLPKDTKQLETSLIDVPSDLISAITKSNYERIEFIVQKILEQKCKHIGIYKLAMKKGSKNSRNSSTAMVAKNLKSYGLKVSIYDENIDPELGKEFNIYYDLNSFKLDCDLIVTNRIDDLIIDVKDKIFTRDVYGDN